MKNKIFKSITSSTDVGQNCTFAHLHICKSEKTNFAKIANFATGYFARVAAVLLMLVTMSVGEVWAATDYITVYFCPGAVGKTWNAPYVNYCPGDNAWFNQAMTNTGKTYNGNAIFSHVLERRYGGFDKVEFHASQNDYNGSITPISSWSSTDISNKMWVGSWIDCTFDETKYDVTVSAGAGGSVSPSGSQQIGATGINVTATPSSGFRFVNWSFTGGAAVASSTNATTKVTATATGSVTANFVENLNSGWFVAGSFNDWANTTDELIKDNGSSSVARVTIRLSAGNYTFKIHRKEGGAKWNGFDTTISDGVPVTLGDNSGDNLKLNGISAGNYEFVYNVSTRELTVNFPAAAQHKVYFGVHSSGNGTLAAAVNSSAISSGADVAQGAIVNFTATPSSGYEVEGWYSNSDCTSKIDAAGTSTTYSPTVGAVDMTVYVKFVKTQYTLIYAACSSGNGSVSGTVASGSKQDPGTEITLTATPNLGYYLCGWYSDAAGNTRLAYAKKTDAYKYVVTLDANKTVYAKFEAIPNVITLDGNINGRNWDNRLNPTSSAAGVYTWEFAEPKANSAKEFCFKGNANNKVVLKPNMPDGVTYAQTGCTSLDDSGDSNHNFRLTNDEKRLTITVTYGSGIHVQVDANDPSCTTPTIRWATAPADGTVGGSMTASVTKNYAGATVTWESSNTTVATVTSAGMISYKAAGSTTITAKYTGDGSTYCATEASISKEITVAAAPVSTGWEIWTGGSVFGTFKEKNGTYTYIFTKTNDNGETEYILKYNGTQYKTAIQYISASKTELSTTGAAESIKFKNLGAGTYTLTITQEGEKWYLNIVKVSLITIYVKSEKGGVLINTGNKWENGSQTGNINGTSVNTKADCTQETWYYITIEADKITDLFLSATGCSQNTEAFTLNGEGSYYFDCTTSQTTQVTAAEYCKSKEVKIYVYSENWNGWAPSIYGQWKTATGGYQGGVNRNMTTVSCAPTYWYELTYDEEHYPGLAYVQIELRLTKSGNTRSHKINNNWTTIAAGTTIYWDITSGCDDNENAPKETDKRPCEGEKTYTVTYKGNGNTSGSVPTDANNYTSGANVIILGNTGSLAKTGYTFGGWNDGSKTYQAGASYIMPKQDVVFTAVWNEAVASSGWYMVGARITSNDWNTTNTTFAFDQKYRGMDNIFYKVVDSYKLGDYFKLHDRKTFYSYGSSGSQDYTKTLAEVSKSSKMTMVQSNESKGALMISDVAGEGVKNVWVVFDVNATKFWIEDIPTLYDVTVTNNVGVAEGSTYTLTNGSVGCAQFATGETYTLTVTPKDGYAAVITVDGVPAQDVLVNPTPQDDMTTITTYTYSAKMGSANIHIDITYEKLTPITVKFRIDALWNKADNFEPMIQWTTISYTTWSGWPSDYSTRIHKLPGYTNWYYWTFEDSKTILKWQLKNGGVGYNNAEAINHSGVIQVTVYDDNLCYAISETPNPYGQRTPNTTDCPDVNAKLTVNGGDLAGSTAALSSTCDLSTTWVSGYTIQKTYSYTYNGKEYALGTDETAENLVAGAGTYVYKVEIELVNNSTHAVVASGIDTKTVVVAAPELSIEPSTTGAAQNTPVSVKTTLKNVACSEKVIICWSLLDSEGNDKSVSFTDNHDGTYSFTTPSKDGTFTIHAELKVGTDCGHATTVAVAEETIKVGSLMAELTVSPASPVTNDWITLEVTASNYSGTVHYTYSVKATSNPTTRVLASNVTSNTNSTFQVPSEDEYTFTVVVTDNNGSVTVSKTIKTGVGNMQMKYCWKSTDSKSWIWQNMEYLGDGIYRYYVTSGDNASRKWTGKDVANTTSGGSAEIPIVSYGTINNGDIVAYYFDNNEKTVFAYGSGVYRLKSVTDYGTFYSNVPKGDGKISFYATASATSKLYLQTMTNGEWETAGESITSITVPKNGIFVADMAANGAVSNLTEYVGTLSAYTGGNMRSYTADGNTTNTFTDFRNTTTTYYDHYYMEYHGAGDAEYGATVGNDINHCLANVLNSYHVNLECNARYEYDSRTNKLSRTMIAGSHDPENNPTHYLAVYGENLTKNTSPYAALKKAAPQDLTDCQNWVYSTRIKGEKPAGDSRDINGYIYAKFNSADRWVLASDGLESSTDAYVTILGGSTTTGTYDLLLMYDYKTNRLTAGWCPESEITIDNQQVVDANIIFMRSEQGEVEQIKLGSDDSKVASLQKAIFVQKLLTSKGKDGMYYYMFALPFDCKVSDIYGLAGRYLSAWGIQRYAGEERAATGWFKEDGKSFWKWVGINETLKAGEGYSLCVNRKKQSWYDGGANYLYFPSTEDGFSLTKSKSDQVIEYAPLHCNIDKSKDTNPEDPTRDRRSYDSNWRLIGTLACNNITIKENGAIHTDGDKEDWLWHTDGTEDEKYYPSGTAKTAGRVPNFIYAIETDEVGKITGYVPTASNGYDFKSFTSYMVQFEGKINWSQYTEAKPEEAISSVAARRYVSAGNTSTRRETMFDLMLTKENEVADQTFVQLAEEATTGFDYNLDLTKIENGDRAQLWSIAENTNYAGNVLPLNVDTIPLTVVVRENGEYTMTMSKECLEYNPLLWDAYEQTITDLNTADYNTQLSAGTWANRYYIILGYRAPQTNEENPDDNSGIATSIRENRKSETGITKVMVNGVLYILREGHLYDGIGRRVK